MIDRVTIRRPQSPAEYLALQNVQRLAWELTDDRYLVPVATLIGADRHGGVVLGAFEESGEAVGMSFGFLARFRGQIGLYSQLTGVAAGHQGRGIGKRLKLAQQKLTRVQQLPVIAWAFDPHQFRNAQFNLTHLGAAGHEFVPDMYGPRTDRLNANTPTDRLIVEWKVEPTARRAVAPKPHSEAQDLVTVRELVPRFSGFVPAGHSPVLISIPTNIGLLRLQRPDLAQAWQNAAKEAFLTAFAALYVATGVQLNPSDSRTAQYILEPASWLQERAVTVISGPDHRENRRMV